MTEIKTLKDFDKICACGSRKESHNPHYIDMNKLKQEAIKWVKEDIERDCGAMIPRTKTWMRRLNIIEDDLK